MIEATVNIARTDLAQVDALASFGVATVHEAQGRKGQLPARLRPIYKGARIAGNAVTAVVASSDNWAIHIAVEQCIAGDLLVVASMSPCDDGYFGELLATALQARGVRGLVIDGGVRDVAELEEMGFPVWSSAISAQGTVKERFGPINADLEIGGVAIRPGDVVVADDDGVCVVRREEAEAVIAASQERLDKEAASRKRLAAGESSLDIYNMRDALAAKGLVYIDQATGKRARADGSIIKEGS